MCGLSYTGGKQDEVERLKAKAINLISRIKDHYMSNEEKERLAISTDEIKESVDPDDLNIWIDHLQSELNYYEKKELEETENYKDYPCDDYGDGYYQKV